MANTLLKAMNAVFLVAMTGLSVTLSAGGAPRPLVSQRAARALAPLEVAAAQAPADAATLRPLVDAYLREGLPGHAVGVIDRSPEAARRSPQLGDLAAASYLASGRTRDAFAMNERVLAACANGGCDATFIARAERRGELLGALLDMGVEDASSDPDAIAVAYRRTARQVQIAMN